MAQATLLGLCSDTVVTILQPSSTIECPLGCSVPGIQSFAPAPITTPTVLPIASACVTLMSGYVEFDIASVTGPTGSVTVTLGSFKATYPLPTTYVGPVVIPFQTITQGNPTLTASVTAATTGNPTQYSYSTLQLF